MLIVFAGLPGTGKTTLARRTADAVGATFLRIDTIEAAIVTHLTPLEDDPVGYLVAADVAADQLRSGRAVVVDAVNNVAEARAGWTALGAATGSSTRFVEVICSDQVEHRRRVEQRGPEMPGHGVPTWQQVARQRWDPWTEPHVTIDNVGEIVDRVADVLRLIGADG